MPAKLVTRGVEAGAQIPWGGLSLATESAWSMQGAKVGAVTHAVTDGGEAGVQGVLVVRQRLNSRRNKANPIIKVRETPGGFGDSRLEIRVAQCCQVHFAQIKCREAGLSLGRGEGVVGPWICRVLCQSTQYLVPGNDDNSIWMAPITLKAVLP